jgi:hypothetical protein
MNLKALVDKTTERNNILEERYGYVFNEYEMWIIDRYLKVLNETDEQEEYIRHILYSFMTLRDTHRH